MGSYVVIPTSLCMLLCKYIISICLSLQSTHYHTVFYNVTLILFDKYCLLVLCACLFDLIVCYFFPRLYLYCCNNVHFPSVGRIKEFWFWCRTLINICFVMSSSPSLLLQVYLLAGYYYTATEEYDIKWTMPHCVLTLKLVGELTLFALLADGFPFHIFLLPLLLPPPVLQWVINTLMNCWHGLCML